MSQADVYKVVCSDKRRWWDLHEIERHLSHLQRKTISQNITRLHKWGWVDKNRTSQGGPNIRVKVKYKRRVKKNGKSS